MTIESQYQSLEEEVNKKTEEIFAKEQQLSLLKEGITRDKKLLKIMTDGLESMKSRMPKTEQK